MQAADDKDAAMRAEFEAWVRTELKLPDHVKVGPRGELVLTPWEAWQEATRRASARNVAQDIREAAELWECALSEAAMYVDAHCVDGEFHSNAIMTMKRPVIRAAAAPEEKPATVRVRITSAGRTHELDVEPRPGMSELTGLLLNAMDQLKRQGMPVGHVTEIRYATEEPCKN
ncbi:hypothetical protein E7V67_011330 [[Empedobacter] haloabium]|uniref:Uncharacterized protein n=1 Tax=[Empedobacter] haloabium TaxID=592317 RepID=A0ABZ1UUK5_9BURK